MNGREEV